MIPDGLYHALTDDTMDNFVMYVRQCPEKSDQVLFRDTNSKPQPALPK